MKTRLLFSAILMFSAQIIFARQYPGVNYQAVARDSSGALLANQLLGLKFTVLQNGAGGDTVYAETDTATTNQYGLFRVVIGVGTPVSGSWLGINWATNAYYVQTSMDATGGTSYADYGSPWELNYVPLAYYALSSGGQYWSQKGLNIYNSNSGYVGIGTDSPLATLHVVNSQANAGDLWLENDNQAGFTGEYFYSQDTLYGYIGHVNDSSSFGGPGTTQFGSTYGDMVFSTDTAGYFMEQMRITTGGNVGIGTSTPSATLEVNGNEVLSYGAARIISTPNATGSNIQGYDLTLQAGSSQYQGNAAAGGNLYLTAGNSNDAGGQGGANVIISAGANYWANNTPQALDGDIIFYGDLGNQGFGNSEIMRISGTTGNVGIGTSNPNAPLHVSTAISSGSTAPSSARTYFAEGSGLTTNISTSNNVMVEADGWFWANGGGFLATSDARIKDIKGKTDNAADLQTLNSIEITNYLYKDKINNGSKPQKKVIAQQVKEVYPQAINQSEGIIPNVYAVASSVSVKDGKTIITTTNPHDFKTGDEVKLIMEKSGEKTLPVTVIDEHTFSVATPINEKVFVYGKEVNDLLTVDYDAISMLNVSATQELAKELKTVQEENVQLKATLATLQGQVKYLSAKVDANTTVPVTAQVGSK